MEVYSLQSKLMCFLKARLSIHVALSRVSEKNSSVPEFALWKKEKQMWLQVRMYCSNCFFPPVWKWIIYHQKNHNFNCNFLMLAC